MATITAHSPKFSDVQAAVNHANPGDTVVVPSGTATWTSTLTISKSLTLQGAGSSTVFQRDSSTAPTFVAPFIYIRNLPSDVPVRVTGIGFNSRVVWPNYDTICIWVTGTSNRSWGSTHIRIDHCAFSWGKRQIWISDWAYGVIDHCKFYNFRESAVHVRGEGYPAINRKDSTQFGSLNCFYVEDCTFVQDNGVPGNYGATDVDFFGSLVMRHNTVDMTALTHSNVDGVFQAHGSQSYWSGSTSDFTGLYRYEAYNNTVKMPAGTYRMGYFRGGRLLFHDNTFTTTDGRSPAMLGLTCEQGWSTFFANRIRTTWPGEEQINNSYFWNNTINGSAYQSIAPWNSNDGMFIRVNRDYWFAAPNGRNVTTYPRAAAPPSASGFPYNIGTSYWPTVTGYTTAPYPHPLVR